MNSEAPKQPFDEKVWHERITENDACIISNRYSPCGNTYYWLANDGKGNPIPFSLLTPLARALFEARVKLAQEYPGKECAVRGVDWFFRCPRCATKSFFTLRGKTCDACQTAFDENLQPKVPIQSQMVLVPRGKLEEWKMKLESELALVKIWLEAPAPLFVELPPNAPQLNSDPAPFPHTTVDLWPDTNFAEGDPTTRLPSRIVR